MDTAENDSDDVRDADAVWDLRGDELKPKSLGAELVNFFDDLRKWDGPGRSAGGDSQLTRTGSMREAATRLRATLARRLEAAKASRAAATVQEGRAAYLRAVRTAVTGSGGVRVRDHLRARWNGQERELLEQLRAARRAARRAVTGSDSKLVRDFLREEPVVRFVDRVAFTFGVLMLVATEAFLLRWPAAFWAFYVVMMPLLLAFRVCQYTALSYQFFMLDFCYFAVAAAGVHAALFPSSAWLGDMVFAWANGPLACAIVVWRNSLVFHSLDKITPVVILHRAQRTFLD